MKNRILWILTLILVIFYAASFMIACDSTDNNFGKPKKKLDLAVSFSLDLNADDEIEIDIADYIDENGATGVTYNVYQESDDNHVSVSAITNGKFTVKGIAVGSSKISLDALQNKNVKVSIDLYFEVVCSPIIADALSWGNFFSRGAWFLKDNESSNTKPSPANVTINGENIAGVQFTGTDGFATKIPFQSLQRFTFMLNTSSNTGEPVQFQFRASDSSSSPSKFYHIGTSDGNIVFSKSRSSNTVWHAKAGTMPVDEWARVDVYLLDDTGITEIAVYLNNEKVTFAAGNIGSTGLRIEDGSIIDSVAPIQSGDWLGFSKTSGITTVAPVPGVKQTLLKDAYSDYFPIGCTVQTSNMNTYKNAGLIGQFNSLTAEYQMKWGNIETSKGTYNWTNSDNLVNFAKQNDMKVRGHALVWYKSIPSWVVTSNKTETLNTMRTYIKAAVKHFDDTVYCWDVVNEALYNEPTASQVSSGNFYRTGATETTGLNGYDWYATCGRDYIKEAFIAADEARKEAGLNVKLIYNDYHLSRPNKRNAAVKMLEWLISENVPIDGIGMQAHFKIDTFDAAEFEKSVKAFTDLGLEVQFTELDISLYNNSDKTSKTLTDTQYNERYAVQQQYFTQIFDVARKYSVKRDLGGGKTSGKVTGLTFWGVADDKTWLNTDIVSGRTDYPLLFGKHCEKKSAFFNVIDLKNFSTASI